MCEYSVCEKGRLLSPRRLFQKNLSFIEHCTPRASGAGGGGGGGGGGIEVSGGQEIY